MYIYIYIYIYYLFRFIHTCIPQRWHTGFGDHVQVVVQGPPCTWCTWHPHVLDVPWHVLWCFVHLNLQSQLQLESLEWSFHPDSLWLMIDPQLFPRPRPSWHQSVRLTQLLQNKCVFEHHKSRGLHHTFDPLDSTLDSFSQFLGGHVCWADTCRHAVWSVYKKNLYI